MEKATVQQFKSFWDFSKTKEKSRNDVFYHPCCDTWSTRKSGVGRSTHKSQITWRQLLLSVSSSKNEQFEQLFQMMLQNKWRIPPVFNMECRLPRVDEKMEAKQVVEHLIETACFLGKRKEEELDNAHQLNFDSARPSSKKSSLAASHSVEEDSQHLSIVSAKTGVKRLLRNTCESSEKWLSKDLEWNHPKSTENEKENFQSGRGVDKSTQTQSQAVCDTLKNDCSTQTEVILPFSAVKVDESGTTHGELTTETLLNQLQTKLLESISLVSLECQHKQGRVLLLQMSWQVMLGMPSRRDVGYCHRNLKTFKRILDEKCDEIRSQRRLLDNLLKQKKYRDQKVSVLEQERSLEVMADRDAIKLSKLTICERVESVVKLGQRYIPREPHRLYK